MNGKLRVGVVGCGIGQGHIHAFRSLPEQFDVVAVCDVDGARAREVATRLQVPRAATNLADVCRFVPQPEGFAGQFTRFHQALQQGAELPVTLADARAALELITAIYTSAQAGEAVALPITPSSPASRP